jgi:hypothetical protein
VTVCDGSLFPTSIGANPQQSIYGLAARNASRLAAELSGRPLPADSSDPGVRPACSSRALSPDRWLLEVALYVAHRDAFTDVMPRRRLPPVAAAGGVLAPCGRLLVGGDLRLWPWAWHSPAPPLSHGAGRCAWCSASTPSCVLSFVLIFPFERWWMAPDRLSGGAEQAAGLARRARRRSCWCTATVVRVPPGGGCAAASKPPAGAWRRSASNRSTRSIERLRRAAGAAHRRPSWRETGAERLLLVGHSMGGLVARRLSAAPRQRRGWRGWSPSGRRTRAASIALHRRSARTRARCSPHSAWLQALANPAPLLDTRGHLQSARQFRDAAREICELPGATQSARSPVVGHLAMLYSPRVAQGAAGGARRAPCGYRQPPEPPMRARVLLLPLSLLSAVCAASRAGRRGGVRHPRRRQPGLFRQSRRPGAKPLTLPPLNVIEPAAGQSRAPARGQRHQPGEENRRARSSRPRATAAWQKFSIVAPENDGSRRWPTPRSSRCASPSSRALQLGEGHAFVGQRSTAGRSNSASPPASS